MIDVNRGTRYEKCTFVNLEMNVLFADSDVCFRIRSHYGYVNHGTKAVRHADVTCFNTSSDMKHEKSL